jgi:hypothetical protein
MDFNTPPDLVEKLTTPTQAQSSRSQTSPSPDPLGILEEEESPKVMVSPSRAINRFEYLDWSDVELSMESDELDSEDSSIIIVDPYDRELVRGAGDGEESLLFRENSSTPEIDSRFKRILALR